MGYVHDTHMSQFIPPTAMHCVTGTWTHGSRARLPAPSPSIRLPTAETTVINIPIMLPSNSVALKGAKLAIGRSGL